MGKGRKALDLTNQQFGRLTALERVGSKRGYALWKCRCECGDTTEVTTDKLRNGNTQSCGCLFSDLASERYKRMNVKHGAQKTVTTEYRAWIALRAKGECPKQWDDFVQFFCDVGERPSPDHVLARKDVRKPYGEENTYWRHPHDERAAGEQLTAADLPSECTFDFRTYLRAAAAASEREAAAG